ncbi:MAG: hypothetical protein KDM63_08235, partial [Verrucomicrobiae bacterium]|nr:hypothetical protein [Verrucomicrobiae bacterium]
MTLDSQSLEFSLTPASIGIGVVFVTVVLVLSFTAWLRSRWKASIGTLEALRVLIAAAIAVTLLQPEWREIYKPENKPTV